MDDPGKAQAEIESAQEPVMLVGHLPHLSRLASAVVFGDPEQELLQLKTAAIACIVRVDEGFRLQWVLTPELARAFAST